MRRSGPIVPHKAAPVAAPVQAISRARRDCPAPQLVPTMATIAVPKPNAIGCRMYSRRAAHGVAEGGVAFQLYRRSPSAATTERLVMAMLIKPGTPTLRMSANSSQRGGTPRKFQPHLGSRGTAGPSFQIAASGDRPANEMTQPPRGAETEAGEGQSSPQRVGRGRDVRCFRPSRRPARAAGRAHVRRCLRRRICTAVGRPDPDGAAEPGLSSP